MTRVACIQFAPVFKEKAENIRRLTGLILAAAEGGAELIVAPELTTTGYSFMSEEEARPFAESPQWITEGEEGRPGTAMAQFAMLARKLHVCIVFGYVEIDLGTQKLHNSQIYIDPSGYYVGYRKINPWGNDWLWSTPGIGNPPIINSVLGKRIGLLICRDIRDKRDDKWTDFYAPGEADIVAFSANFGKGAFPSNSWMEFAKDNNTTLCVSNRYGIEENNDFGSGGVCVIHPDGKVDCKGLAWNQDCIVYSDV